MTQSLKYVTYFPMYCTHVTLPNACVTLTPMEFLFHFIGKAQFRQAVLSCSSFCLLFIFNAFPSCWPKIDCFLHFGLNMNALYFIWFIPSFHGFPLFTDHKGKNSSYQCQSFRPWWLGWMCRPTGDQEVAGSIPIEVGNIHSWRLTVKYFLWSFSPFRWFKKGSCQFLAKEVHNTG